MKNETQKTISMTVNTHLLEIFDRVITTNHPDKSRSSAVAWLMVRFLAAEHPEANKELLERLANEYPL